MTEILPMVLTTRSLVWVLLKVLDEMMIMDLSGIRKRFASKMEYPCGIRDGSEVGVKRDCCEMARALPCNFRTTLITYEEGKEKVRTAWYGAISVKLPGGTERLFIVVVKRFGRGAYNAFNQLKDQSEGHREFLADCGDLSYSQEV